MRHTNRLRVWFADLLLCLCVLILSEASVEAANITHSLTSSSGEATSANYSDEAIVHDLVLWLPSLCVYPTI